MCNMQLVLCLESASCCYMQTLSYVLSQCCQAPGNTDQTVPTLLLEQLHHHLLTENLFDMTIAKSPFILTWQYKL